MEAMLDFAVRNSRVLARHALRHSRGRLAAPDGLPAAVRELAQAVWTLAWGGAEARGRALAALAGRARPSSREPDLVVTEAVRQVRATAVGLMCAAELVEDSLEPSVGMPTAQLLARPLLPLPGVSRLARTAEARSAGAAASAEGRASPGRFRQSDGGSAGWAPLQLAGSGRDRRCGGWTDAAAGRLAGMPGENVSARGRRARSRCAIRRAPTPPRAGWGAGRTSARPRSSRSRGPPARSWDGPRAARRAGAPR
jgi:hypothetical protein